MLTIRKFNLGIGIVMSIIVTSSFVVAQESSVYKFKEAGIQFVVPAGWEVEKRNDGGVTISGKDGETYIVVALTTFGVDTSMLTPDAQYKAFAEGALPQAKEGWKGLHVDEPTKATLNGVPMIAQPFRGTKDGVEMGGAVMLLTFDKLVGVFSLGSSKVSDKLDKESKDLFGSIKKIVPSQTTLAQQNNPNVQKIAEAGIQFTVPAGWSVEKDKNGTVTVSKKDNDGYVVIALTSLPTDPSLTLDKEFTLFSQGILDSVKKDWKGYKAEDVAKDTQNGMPVIVQVFSGTAPDAGGELEGMVIVMGSAKPLGIFAQRTKKHSDTLDKESTDLLGSIKKIG